MPDQDARILSKRKANYSRIGDEIELRWDDGVLAPTRQPAASGLERVNRLVGAERTFLDLLATTERQKRHVSSSRNAGNYAPKMFGKMPNRGSFKRADFEAAMNALFDAGRITNVEYGRKGDARFRIALAPKKEGGGDATDTNAVSCQDGLAAVAMREEPSAAVCGGCP